MKRTTLLRRLIDAPEILVLPGVQDALTARIAARAGFKAVVCGGYAATAALLGEPDTSQLSMREMADHYARLADAVDLPVFADADTGYGNVTNVRRTVRAYEQAGVAGLLIEDQVFPKRCGHMAGKAVVPAEEMVAKLKAALDARRDPDLVIMARTDSLAVNGLDEAIARGQLYRAVGADAVFVEAPADVAQMRRICAEIDAPCMANMVEGGLTPYLTAAELQAIGFAVVALPVATSLAVARIVSELMAAIARDGNAAALLDRMMLFDAFNELVGLGELRRREAADLAFAQAAVQRKPAS